MPASSRTGRPSRSVGTPARRRDTYVAMRPGSGSGGAGVGLGRVPAPAASSELSFEELLFRVRPLAPVRPEDLDAVVLVGIVRGRDGDPGARADLEHELGHAGRGDDSRRGDAAARIREPRGQIGDDARRRLARVSAEDDARRPGPVEAAAELAAEEPHRRRSPAGTRPPVRAARPSRKASWPGALSSPAAGRRCGRRRRRRRCAPARVTIWPSRTRTPAACGARVAETWNEAFRSSTETGSVRIWVIRARVFAGPDDPRLPRLDGHLLDPAARRGRPDDVGHDRQRLVGDGVQHDPDLLGRDRDDLDVARHVDVVGVEKVPLLAGRRRRAGR